MDSVNIGGDQSYIINLDSIDLAYLAKYVSSPHAERRSLWTRTRLDGQSEYCRVQIGTQDDSEDCYSEPFDTYKCHICNVRVPTMCYKEHNGSEQHKTIKNISQKILDRVSKQINTPIINNDEDIVKDVYFCVPCSKIVKIENKNRHESSTYHVKSIKNISIITEFYDILKKNESCDEGNDINDEKDEKNDVESDSSKANNNHDTTDENLYNNLDSDDDSVDQSSVTDKPRRIPRLGNTENDNQSTSYEKTESFEEYLKEMIKKYNLKVNLPVINGEYISIVAPNGDTVKVSREHFQSYQQLHSSVYCQMCEMWIFQDTRRHDVTEFHVRNVLKPINANFTRTIDTITSHCVPCNKVVGKESNHHTVNENHKKIIKDTGLPNTRTTFCQDCNRYIDSHNYTSHISSNKHYSALLKQNSVHRTEDNTFICKICNITLSIHNLNDHVASERHIAKKTNGATEINNESNDSTEIYNENNDATSTNNESNVSLELCSENNAQGSAKPGSVAQNGSPVNTNTENVRFAGANPTTSAESSLSASSSSNALNIPVHQMDAYYNLLEYTNAAKTKVRCKICFVNMTFNVRNIIEHMQGRRHVVHSKNKMQVFNQLLSYTDEAKTKRKCVICDVNIPDNEHNIIEHMEGRRHVVHFKNKMQVFNQLLSYTDEAKTKLKCVICDVNVPDNERNIIEHMVGRNHEVAEKELLVYHVITKESSGYKCECCDEEITDYFEHINGRTHTLKCVEKYEIDKTVMRKYVYEDDTDNSVARRHRERYKNLLKYNDIYNTDGTNFYCGICHIKFGRVSEIYHVLGERHALKLKETGVWPS